MLDSKGAVVGLAAMVVCALLAMGGLSFLAVSLFISDLPRLFLAVPVAQIGLGLVGFLAGLLLMRGRTRAGYVLVFIAIGILTNFVFHISMIIVMAVNAT